MACNMNVPQSQRHLNTVTILCKAYFLGIEKHLRALGIEPVLGTSHNLSWRGGGGVEEKLGGLQFFGYGIWGALKGQKMTSGGGVFKFLLSSIPTEQHDA